MRRREVGGFPRALETAKMLLNGATASCSQPGDCAMTAALGTSARQALLALMVSVTKTSNPDLRAGYRVEIDRATRTELANEKLITWRRGSAAASSSSSRTRAGPCSGGVHVSAAGEPEWGVAAALRDSSSCCTPVGTHRRKIADLYVDADPGPDGTQPAPPPIEEQVRPPTGISPTLPAACPASAAA